MKLFKNLKYCQFSHKVFLLICNSHTIKFSLLKCIIQWGLVYSQCVQPSPLANSRTSSAPKSFPRMLDQLAIMTFYSPSFLNQKAFTLKTLISKLWFFLLKCLVVGRACRGPEAKYSTAHSDKHEDSHRKYRTQCMKSRLSPQIKGPSSMSSFNGAKHWTANIHFACNIRKICTQWSTVSGTECTHTRPRNPALQQTLHSGMKFTAGGFWEETFGQWRAASRSPKSWLMTYSRGTQLLPLLGACDGFLWKDHHCSILILTDTWSQAIPRVSSFILIISTLSFFLLSSSN